MDREKDIIKVIADDSRLYRYAAVITAAVVIAAAFFAGFLIPKPIGAVTMRLNAYEKKDREYLDALNAYDKSEQEVKMLNDELSEKQTELEKFNGSRGSLDKITERITELQTQKEQLQNEISAKRAVLDTLTPKAEGALNSTVTLSSGRYTVGENIIAGTYMITGTGSIVISAGGKARVNKAIKSGGEEFTLSDGEIIKIDGSARLTRED